MSKNTEQKPLGFGQTMLASAVGVVIAFAVLNIIAFIICMGLLVSALSSSMEQSTPITGSNLAVELDLTQTVSERKLGGITSLFGEKRGTSIEQLLTTMENASVDDRVKAIYLHLGGSTLDWAQAEELKDAVVRFHNNCDKPILAYGDAMTQPEYYLATNANLLAVHPSGVIEFKGMGAEAIFYKGLLDKLGVHMELIRPTSCTYKSAGETYVRTNMSDANREQVRSYINSIWDYAVESMAANRGLRVQQLNTLADNLSGFLPDEALRNGLVDTLCFEQDIKQMMHDNYGVTKIVKANRYAENVRQTKTKESTDQIALIYAEGNVVPGKSYGAGTAVYGDDIVKALTDATKDKKVKAIVLRVNSPGGAVTASESMTHAVREAKKVKPVVISMSGLAASAGYEISCFGTKIVAHPTTLTGSIGVFATIPEVGTFLRQKLGITTDTVMTNRNSSGLSGLRPLSADARQMLQRNVEDFYITFTQRVADGRGLTRTYVDSIARGRVWTGIQAKEIGLVDTLGGLPLALSIAAKEAGIEYETSTVKVFPKEKSLWEQVMEQMDESKEEEIKARLNAIIPFYSELEQWSQMEPLQARLPFLIKID